MIKQKITAWEMRYGGRTLAAEAPCSLYSVLLAHKIIEDPFYRLNEAAATALSEQGMELSAKIFVTEAMLAKKHVDVHFLGVDTLCEAYLNGEFLLGMENMHREWRADARELLRAGENELLLRFASPSEYIRRKNAEHYLYTSTAGGAVMEGTGHIRKASCMFGWDWGPQLPDMGIYRDVLLEAYDARMEDISVRQEHAGGEVKLRLCASAVGAPQGARIRAVLTAPSGERRETEFPAGGEGEIEVENPALWWPNGLGGNRFTACAWSSWRAAKRSTARRGALACAR